MAIFNHEISPNKESLSKEAAKNLGKQTIATEEMTGEHADVKFWAGEYRDIERDFANKEYGRIPENEFSIWEKEAKGYYDKMKQAADEEGLNRYERDRVEQLAVVRPHETIESYSGNFYDERRDRLMNAIPKDSPDYVDAQKFPMLVMEHLSKQYDFETRSFDAAVYQARRTRAHNDMIRGLNHLNHLAEKYGTERFTFRDFETNDFRYDKEFDRTGETNARAEYDRGTVEDYARAAFSREFDQAEREAEYSVA